MNEKQEIEFLRFYINKHCGFPIWLVIAIPLFYIVLFYIVFKIGLYFGWITKL
ncbi:MAG: hypothetical protein ACFFDF_03755 [Candidatus Odinarchaeota archaeon]